MLSYPKYNRYVFLNDLSPLSYFLSQNWPYFEIVLNTNIKYKSSVRPFLENFSDENLIINPIKGVCVNLHTPR